MTSCAKLRGLLYRKLKIAIQVPKTYIYPLFCVLSTTTLVSKNWPLATKRKGTYKGRKSVYNIEMYFKQFFTSLKRTSTFITIIFRALYRSSSPEVFSEKGVLPQICSIFTEEYSWSHTFAWMFSCKLSKLFVEHLSWKAPLGDCFCLYKSGCSI